MKTEGQQPLTVAKTALSLVTQDIQYMMRNILIRIIAVFIFTPHSLCLHVSLWQFLAQNKVLSLRSPGFRSYWTLLITIQPPPPPHHLPPTTPHTPTPSPPVTQLWPCAAHENSHQIILTKHQHLLLGDTPFITHTCIHTHANRLIYIYKVNSVYIHMLTYIRLLREQELNRWENIFIAFTTHKETCCK